MTDNLPPAGIAFLLVRVSTAWAVSPTTVESETKDAANFRLFNTCNDVCGGCERRIWRQLWALYTDSSTRETLHTELVGWLRWAWIRKSVDCKSERGWRVNRWRDRNCDDLTLCLACHTVSLKHLITSWYCALSYWDLRWDCDLKIVVGIHSSAGWEFSSKSGCHQNSRRAWRDLERTNNAWVWERPYSKQAHGAREQVQGKKVLLKPLNNYLNSKNRSLISLQSLSFLLFLQKSSQHRR